MAQHYELSPRADSLPLTVAQEALRIAQSGQTVPAGSIYIPNGDGTGTLLGAQSGTDHTGMSNGIIQWVGDTEAPGVPTGINATCSAGILIVEWDGTLLGGVPADFARIDVHCSIGENTAVTLGSLQEAGTLSVGTLTVGDYDVWATAVDTNGNTSPQSAHVSVTVTDPVGQLETMITTNDQGIEVGRNRNGVFTGPSALVSSDGSFDLRDHGTDTVRTVSKFDKTGIYLMPYTGSNKHSNGYQFSIIPFERKTTGSVTYTINGVNLLVPGVFALNGIPATPASNTVRIQPKPGLDSNRFVKWDVTKLKKDAGIILNCAEYRRTYYEAIDGTGVVPTLNFRHAIAACPLTDGQLPTDDNECRCFVILNPGLYAIQGQFNVQKTRKTMGEWTDAQLVTKPAGAKDWTIPDQANPAYRIAEQGEGDGWYTGGSPCYYVKLDVGTRISWKFLSEKGTPTVGTLCNFTVTRLPFSGEYMA